MTMTARRIPSGEYIDVYYTGEKVITCRGVQRVYREYGEGFKPDILECDLRFEDNKED